MVGTDDLSSQETAAERRVRDDLDAEFAGGLQETDLGVLNVEREGRVLDLDCSDWVHSMSSAQRLRGHLGKAKVLDFTLP